MPHTPSTTSSQVAGSGTTSAIAVKNHVLTAGVASVVDLEDGAVDQKLGAVGQRVALPVDELAEHGFPDRDC